jgi:hypothetical protein
MVETLEASGAMRAYQAKRHDRHNGWCRFHVLKHHPRGFGWHYKSFTGGFIASREKSWYVHKVIPALFKRYDSSKKCQTTVSAALVTACYQAFRYTKYLDAKDEAYKNLKKGMESAREQLPERAEEPPSAGQGPSSMDHVGQEGSMISNGGGNMANNDQNSVSFVSDEDMAITQMISNFDEFLRPLPL